MLRQRMIEQLKMSSFTYNGDEEKEKVKWDFEFQNALLRSKPEEKTKDGERTSLF
jgi:hypothetical protein